MTRLLLAAALAAGLLWASNSAAPAQDAKEPTPTPPAGGLSPQTQKINELIAKGWESAGVKKPAAKATDLEFMRRVFIDLIGRIPTPEEILDFEGDRTANKRARLVHRLLNDTGYAPKVGGRPVTAIAGLKMAKEGLDYNDAYAQNFAEIWTTWMLTRSNTHPQYREQFRVWLADQFAKGEPWNTTVQKIIGANGRTASNNAVVFVLRHLGDPLVDAEAKKKGEREDYGKNGKFDAVPVTSRVTKLFLGIQSQCVQCHKHPFNKEYVQADFWGVNGFFRQTDRSGNTNVPVMRNNATGEVAAVAQLELTDMPEWNTKPRFDNGTGLGMVEYEQRTGEAGRTWAWMLRDLAAFQSDAKPPLNKLLKDGVIPSKFAGKTRRQVLGIWVTEHDNFSRAFVNRVWGHLFGRGLNKEPAVDDFSRNNEVVHPELLDYLGEEFAKYNYDPKKLLEWICTSDVYNLSHVANKAYAEQKFDPFFARMPLKAMSPEVLFDSLAVATRIETRKAGDYLRLKSDWTQKLTQNFGDDEGNEINFNGTVVQALLMMNGKEINNEVGSKKGGLIDEVMKKRLAQGPQAVYDELFLMTISRHPTAQEVAELERVRVGMGSIVTGPAPKGKGPLTTPVIGANGTADTTFYQDVFWALLNSREFLLNH